jgi:hypothetical protein
MDTVAIENTQGLIKKDLLLENLWGEKIEWDNTWRLPWENKRHTW